MGRFKKFGKYLALALATTLAYTSCARKPAYEKTEETRISEQGLLKHTEGVERMKLSRDCKYIYYAEVPPELRERWTFENVENLSGPELEEFYNFTDLYKININTGKVERIVRSPYIERSPSELPDRRLLLVLENKKNKEFAIGVYDPKTKTLEEIIKDIDFWNSCEISSDGEYAILAGTDIWQYSFEDKSLKKIIERPGKEENVDLSKNGEMISYTRQGSIFVAYPNGKEEYIDYGYCPQFVGNKLLYKDTDGRLLEYDPVKKKTTFIGYVPGFNFAAKTVDNGYEIIYVDSDYSLVKVKMERRKNE